MRTNRGFTLIELLVVIAIIGMLSSIVLASLNTARAKANDAKRLEDMHSLATALELYYNDNGKYPGSNDQWFDIENCHSSYTNLSDPTGLGSSYIKVPTDPTGQCNWYWNKKSGQGYMLMFIPQNAAIISQGQGCYSSSYYCIGVNWQ